MDQYVRLLTTCGLTADSQPDPSTVVVHLEVNYTGTGRPVPQFYYQNEMEPAFYRACTRHGLGFTWIMADTISIRFDDGSLVTPETLSKLVDDLLTEVRAIGYGAEVATAIEA